MGIVAHAIADAGMDARLRDYLRQASRSQDRARIEEAQRALQIRRNPKFLALIDLIDGIEIGETRGRQRHPERVAAAARLLDTASIALESDTTQRARREAAKHALRAILAELRIEDTRRREVTRQILVMARDWAVARAAQKRRVQLHLTRAAVS